MYNSTLMIILLLTGSWHYQCRQLLGDLPTGTARWCTGKQSISEEIVTRITSTLAKQIVTIYAHNILYFYFLTIHATCFDVILRSSGVKIYTFLENCDFWWYSGTCSLCFSHFLVILFLLLLVVNYLSLHLIITTNVTTKSTNKRRSQRKKYIFAHLKMIEV